MASFDDAFGTLADADMWEEAAAVLAGFLAPSIVANVAEGNTPFDVPDEGYGIAVMFLAQYSPMYSGSLTLGGGMYSVDKLLQRFGLKQTITQMGGN
jgi:hypothetical protein